MSALHMPGSPADPRVPRGWRDRPDWFRLGLAGGLIPSSPAEIGVDLVESLQRLGVEAVALNLVSDDGAFLRRESARIGRLLRQQGVAVAQSTGYRPNLVAADRATRSEAMRRLEVGFEIAELVGAESVLTGCGSYHPISSYGPDPRNFTAEARACLVGALSEAEPVARRFGLPLVLECHVATTLNSASTIASILDEVGSPWVRVNCDPVNLVADLPTLYSNGAMLRRLPSELGRHFGPNAHVKDVTAEPRLVVHIEEVPPGEGVWDFEAFFDLCVTLSEHPALLVEHLDRAQASPALAYVRARASSGISRETVRATGRARHHNS